MKILKLMQKILTATVVFAFVSAQCNVAYAADVDEWNDLVTGVNGATDNSFNVTADSLTASDSNGTLIPGASGISVSGGKLIQNTVPDPLLQVNSGLTFTLGNEIEGSIVNNGTLNYGGAGLSEGTITGSGTLQFIERDSTESRTITNENDITQQAIVVQAGADVDNSGTIVVDTLTVNEGGRFDTDADLLNISAGAITNNGIITLLSGTNGDKITGNGSIVFGDADGIELDNNAEIQQAFVGNHQKDTLNNNALITATGADGILNRGTIVTEAGNLVASGGKIQNHGTLTFIGTSTGTSDITGVGNVTVSGTTTLTGFNDYAGVTSINGGKLIIGGTDNVGSGDIYFDHGVLQVTNAGTLANNLVGALVGTMPDRDVSVQNDGNLSLTGNIAGRDFHKSGAGKMTLAMDSTSYRGNTYVDEGWLVGNTRTIHNTVNGKADTTVEFTDDTDAQLNGIETAGTFVKSGSGLFNVQDNEFSANIVELNNGTLMANRAITATTLNVNSGATLGGNGQITGTVNVNNGATLAPGDGVGTLQVTGDVNFLAGSTTAIQIDETPASDQILISGDANIDSGANLTIANKNGRYFEWERFELINANNVNGTFVYDGTITDFDTSRIDVELDYSDPTKVILVAKRKGTSYGDIPNLSHNEKEIVKVVDNISTGFGGDITDVLLQLELLAGLNPSGVTQIDSGATFKSALNDMHGGVYANGALTTLFNAKTAHVYDRIGKRNPSAGKCAHCHDNLWAEYYNQYDRVSETDDSPRFTNRSSGGLVGYDGSSDTVLLGVYAGFGKDDLRQHTGRLDIDETTLGVYAGYMPGNWIFKSTLYGGYQHYKGRRSIHFMKREAESSYDGWNVGLDLEGAYNFTLARWVNLKPFVGVLGNYASQESFKESGADSLNLRVKSHNQFNAIARLGAKFDGKVSRLGWYASAAVKQLLGDDYAKVKMSLDFPGTDMKIRGAEMGKTYFSGGAGLTYALTNTWSIFGDFEAGVNNNSNNYYGDIGVSYTW